MHLSKEDFTKNAALRGAGKGALKALKSLKWKHWDRPFEKLPKTVRRGYAQQAKETGMDSIMMMPINLIGGDKAKNWVAKNIAMPALKADTAVGSAANKLTSKVTPFKKVFKINEKVPVGGKMYRQVERESLTAPVAKASRIIFPFAGAAALDKQVREGFSQDNSKMQKKAESSIFVKMEKTSAVKLAKEVFRLSEENQKLASDNQEYFQKERATQLLFKQAQMGLIDMPASYEELQEKVASLAKEDLDIVEKAMSLQIGDTGIGKIGGLSSQAVPSTPEEEFFIGMLS